MNTQSTFNARSWCAQHSRVLLAVSTVLSAGCMGDETLGRDEPSAGILTNELTSNVLQNPGFESDKASWTHWDNGTSISTDAASGSKSLQVGPNKGTWGGTGIGQIVSSSLLKPGIAARISASGKRVSGSDWCGLAVTFRSGSTKTLEKILTYATTSYAQKSIDFTIPSKFDSVEVWAWCDQSSVMRIDNVALSVEASNSTGTPSPKKGIGAWYFTGVTPALADVKVSWFYNWRPNLDYIQPPPGLTFVPMTWNGADVTDANLAHAKTLGNILLGFNEPDHTDQSNMSVSEALNLWPKLMATEMKLCSPATAGDPSKPGSWQENFMNGVKANNYRVDMLCVHWYGGNFDTATAVNELKTFLQNGYNKYKLPIWLTEYALINWTNPATFPTAAQQAAFAEQSVPMLESLPFVERYAWFALPPYHAVLPGENISLYKQDGTATTVGAAYRSVGLH